jgi:hypothetical protein
LGGGRIYYVERTIGVCTKGKAPKSAYKGRSGVFEKFLGEIGHGLLSIL